MKINSKSICFQRMSYLWFLPLREMLRWPRQLNVAKNRCNDKENHSKHLKREKTELASLPKDGQTNE